jgi:hypothetical protein
VSPEIDFDFVELLHCVSSVLRLPRPQGERRTDGRQVGSLGATLKNVQDILLDYGAYNAYNLDGGASSTMVYDSSVVNKPSDIMGERYVPCAFIVTKPNSNSLAYKTRTPVILGLWRII